MAMSTSRPAGGDGTYKPMAEINVTPFVDVMLVLLIIFMVAAPLMITGVHVDLPLTSPNGAEAIAPAPIPVTPQAEPIEDMAAVEPPLEPLEVPELASEPEGPLAVTEPQIAALEAEDLPDPDEPPVPKPRPPDREIAAVEKPAPQPKAEPKPKAEPAPKKETPPKPKAGQQDGSEKKVATKPKTDAKAGAAARQRYGDMMESRIKSRASRSVRDKGRVSLAWSVSESGRVFNVRVTRSSGSSEIDNAGLQAVRSAGPFARFTPDMAVTQLDGSITLNFR